MQYRPDFVLHGRMGWLRKPCRGTMYGMAGQRACGPSPRGLDRLAVEIRDGSMFVDLRRITYRARRPPGVPSSGSAHLLLGPQAGSRER